MMWLCVCRVAGGFCRVISCVGFFWVVLVRFLLVRFLLVRFLLVVVFFVGLLRIGVGFFVLILGL